MKKARAGRAERVHVMIVFWQLIIQIQFVFVFSTFAIVINTTDLDVPGEQKK